MTRKQKAELDRQIQEIVSRRCSGLAINIMDIGKVFDAAYRAYSGVGVTGQDVEAAVVLTYTQLARR